MRKALTLLVLGAALVATAILLLPSAAAADGNDDYLNATLVSTGSNGPFDIDPTGDPDWYTFTIFTLSNTRVELNGSSGDTIMYLYDANISYMDYDDDGGVGSFSRMDDPLQPGTYFVYVQAADGVSTIYGYYLTLDPVEPFPLEEGTNGHF